MRRNAAALRLRKFVDAYQAERKGKLDIWANKLLARLTAHPNVVEAFERLNLKGCSYAIPILHSCVVAELLARTFAERVMAEKQALTDLKRLTGAVDQLTQFVSQQAEERSNAWRGIAEEDGLLLVTCKPAEFATMKSGLDLIASLILGRQYLANSIDQVLGATRNKHQKDAPHNVAIWQIAGGIRRVTGRPRLREVADLAEAVLGTTVSLDRVRAVVRKRQQR